jgi:hypothetical protein
MVEKINSNFSDVLFKHNSYTMSGVTTNLNKGDVMAKGKDAQKTVKKKSEKTLKEKRSDKKAKKSQD